MTVDVAVDDPSPSPLSSAAGMYRIIFDLSILRRCGVMDNVVSPLVFAEEELQEEEED